MNSLDLWTMKGGNLDEEAGELARSLKNSYAFTSRIFTIIQGSLTEDMIMLFFFTMET